MASLRVVLRGLARTPLFTLVAILSLALGIGANTAIFSMLDQVLLRILPVKNPYELVYLYHPGPLQGSVSTDEPDQPSFSYPMLRELQKQQTPFTGLAGARSQFVSLAFKNSASHGNVRLVSGNYFDLMGVRPAIGRLFTEDDDGTPGAHAVTVLSHNYWSTRFGADPSVLNQPLNINGYPMTVVGVAQKGFYSERLGAAPDVYVPICMRKEIDPESQPLTERRSYWVALVGRLKPGVTAAQAEAAINIPYRSQLELDVQLLRQPRQDFLQRFRAKKIILKPGQYGRGGLREQGRQPLLLLMGMAGLVLLIACANVANLQLARSATRTREVAIRLAMGASRMQLVRQLLTESCLLAIAGGVLGLIAAKWTVRAIIASLPPSRSVQGVLSDSLDARILLFALALSLLTGILFGLFPALQGSKPNVVSSLKDQAGQISASGSANAFRKALVTAQVALSLVLLISAGLFAKTLVNLASVELGVKTDHLMTFALLPKLNQYSDQRIASLHRQLRERLAAIPGVTLASASQVPAIAGWISSTDISVEGYAPADDRGASANVNRVDAGYFRTLGIPLVVGREFSPADNPTAPKVAIVNEAFVRHFLAGKNPLGMHLGPNQSNLDTQIVGVVKDSHYSSVKEAPPAVFYTPLEQTRRWFTVFYYLRTSIDPERTATSIRREVAALDPGLPIRDLKTMQAQIEENMFEERIMSVLTGSFAGLATLLAAVGLYGVLAYTVARRTREIGIRMALGADAGRVRGLVVREVLLMLFIGTAAGLGGAAATGRFLESFLVGMKAWNLAVYGSAALVLWLVAMGAAWIPARRATAVDPIVALRYE